MKRKERKKKKRKKNERNLLQEDPRKQKLGKTPWIRTRDKPLKAKNQVFKQNLIRQKRKLHPVLRDTVSKRLTKQEATIPFLPLTSHLKKKVLQTEYRQPLPTL